MGAQERDAVDIEPQQKPARVETQEGTVDRPSQAVPQGAPESPRVPGQGPGDGDGGAAQGPSLTYDMSAFNPQAPALPQQPPPPPEDTEGKIRLATVLPVGTFDAGDGLVISQYGTLCTPEQAQQAREKALLARVHIKEIP